jgi:hypothetical protein
MNLNTPLISLGVSCFVTSFLCFVMPFTKGEMLDSKAPLKPLNFLTSGVAITGWGLGGWIGAIAFALGSKNIEIISAYDAFIKVWYVPYFPIYFFIGGLVALIPHYRSILNIFKQPIGGGITD